MRFSPFRLLLLLAGLGLNNGGHKGGGVSAQVTTADVEVDLRPCFLTQVEIVSQYHHHQSALYEQGGCIYWLLLSLLQFVLFGQHQSNDV